MDRPDEPIEVPRFSSYSQRASQQPFTFAPTLQLGAGSGGGITINDQLRILETRARCERENMLYAHNLTKKGTFERITGGTLTAVMEVVAVMSALAPVLGKYFELQAVEAAAKKKDSLEEKAFQEQSDLLSIKLESEAIDKYLEKLRYIDREDPEFQVLQRKYVSLVEAHGLHIGAMIARKNAQENVLQEAQMIPVES